VGVLALLAGVPKRREVYRGTSWVGFGRPTTRLVAVEACTPGDTGIAGARSK
jgi:hypothetical protein